MAMPPWDQRFFASTRGQIVVLLRRSSHTVEELAQVLNLTDNAVRAHLATLERDGLVHQQGTRRGNGKPAFLYTLTPAAEGLFPKAYGTVLYHLLDALTELMAPEDMEALLRAVGRRIAAEQAAPTGDLQARLAIAVESLNQLGGLAELEEQEGLFAICGYRCPLERAVQGHPEICKLTEALLTELSGVPVQGCCERSNALRCCFVVAKQGREQPIDEHIPREES